MAQELSIIIPTKNEATNIGLLIGKIQELFAGSALQYEIIVVDGGSGDDTVRLAREKGARVLVQESPGYGGALREGFKAAQGKYLITLDADFSHNPYIIKRLYALRDTAHVIIASRYVRGGFAHMPFFRYALSVLLNRVLCSVLSLPIKDLSSGFRLYRASIFKEIDFHQKDFDVLLEIVIRAYMNGFSVREIPFHYQPRSAGKSNAKVIQFGLGFVRTILKMRRLHNSVLSADYDDRAFHSRIFLQRYWHRARYKIITGLVGYGGRMLDIGCGTSQILAALPQCVGLDRNFNKLRYNLSLGNHLVNADARALCFKDENFDVVICSEVIEHIPRDEKIFSEFNRVLKHKGLLVLGTPDYSSWLWCCIEWLYGRLFPGGYAKEHITHYRHASLVATMKEHGFTVRSCQYVFGSEMICAFVKE